MSKTVYVRYRQVIWPVLYFKQDTARQTGHTRQPTFLSVMPPSAHRFLLFFITKLSDKLVHEEIAE